MFGDAYNGLVNEYISAGAPVRGYWNAGIYRQFLARLTFRQID